MRGSWRYLLLLAMVVACSQGAEHSAATSPAADTVVAERVSVVGRVNGPPEYTFGDVTSVAIGPGEDIYVADRLGSTVRAYDESGRFLGSVASEGQGPGELEWPNDLVFSGDGRLFVRDAYRISIFAPRASTGIADSVLRTIKLPGYANLSSTRATTDGRRYYYPAYLFRIGEPERYFYVVFDSAGVTGDTVRVPPLPNLQFTKSAFYRTGPGGGRMVQGLNRAPFEPRASWDVTPAGAVITTTGDEYQLVEYGPSGDTVRVMRVPDQERSVPAKEAADSERAFQARLDSLPVPRNRVEGMSPAARSGRIPTVLPAILAVHTTRDGYIWVRRWPPEDADGTTYFDVLDSLGVRIRTVRVPAALQLDPPPFFTSSRLVGVVADPATGIQRVALFRIPER